VHSLFGVRLRQLMVVVVFITLCLVVVVHRVGALRAKKSRDFLVIVRVHFLNCGIWLDNVQGVGRCIAKGVRHFPITLEVPRLTCKSLRECWVLILNADRRGLWLFGS